MRACRGGGFIFIALMAAAAPEVRGQALGTGGDVRNVLILESKKPAWVEKSVAIILANDRVNFNTSADSPDIYQSRSNPSRIGRAPKTTPQSRSPLPPLPVRRSESAQDLQTQADLFRDQGRYREAEDLLRRGLSGRQQEFDKDRPETAQVLDRLAWITRALGKYEEAKSLYVQALAILEKTPGPEHPDTARSLDGLAMLHIGQNQLREAEPLARRALAIRMRTLGPEHPDTAKSLETLGALHIADQFADAEAPLQQALVIREDVFGLEHADTARSIARLAQLRHRQKRIVEAEQLARRSLEIREKVLRPDHPDTLASQDLLARVLLSLQRLADAEPLARRSLEGRLASLGAAHPATVNTFLLSTVLYRQLKRPDSIPLGERLLATAQSQGTHESPELVPVLDQMADLYSSIRRDRPERKEEREAAEAFLRRALTVQERKLGPEHHEIAERLGALASHIRSQGRMDEIGGRTRQAERVEEAERLYTRALGISEKIHGMEHEKTISRLEALAQFYMDQKRYPEVEQIYKRILPAVERIFGRDDPKATRFISLLARVLKEQGRYAEAEEFYLREFSIAEKRISTGELNYSSLDSSLLDIYEQQHRITELEALHKRLLSAVEKAPGPEEKALYFITRIASFYFRHERYSEAERYYKRALELSEKNPGHERYDLLGVFEQLAKIYMETGSDAEAEPLLKRELAIAEAHHGPESYEVVSRIERLARFYANLNRADEAIPLFERLIAAGQKEAREKGDSSRLGEAFRQLGELYQRQGRFAETEALYKRQHAFGEEILLAQKNASAYNSAVTQLSVLYRDRNRPEEQEAVLRGSLELHEKIFGEAGPQLLSLLQNLALFQGRQGRYAEAEKLYRRAVAIQERNGVNPQYILPMLAIALEGQGRYGEAEGLYKRVLAARENEIGPEDFRVSSYGSALHNLVKRYQGLGRTAEIGQLYERTAALIEEKVLRPANQKKAALLLAVAQLYHDHGRYAEAARAAEQRLALVEAEGHEEAIRKTLHIVGSLYLLQERLADAEPVVKRALSLAEKLHGPDNVETAMAAQNLARVYRRQVRYREAEALFLRAFGIVEAERAKIVSLSRNSSRRHNEYLYIRNLSDILNNLGLLYEDTGDYNKAEQSLRRNLEIVYTPAFAVDYNHFATALEQLGSLYLVLGRLSEAEPLLKQAFEVNEKINGPAHLNTAITLHNLGLLRLEQRRHAEGEDLLRRALAISERASGPEHISVAERLNILGQVLAEQGRHDEAEPLLKRALAISERTFRPEHPDIALKLKALADLYIRQNRNAEASATIQRVLAIVKKTLGDGHDWTAISLDVLASVNERLGDWSEAHRLRNEATGLLIGRARQHEADGKARFGGGNAKHYSGLYLHHAHTAMRLAQRDSNQTQALIAEAFEIVQRAQQSEAATALAQTQARLSTGKDELARWARQRQDLAERFNVVNKALVALDLEKLGSDAKSDQRNELRKEREEIERQIAETDALLRERFPDYAALVDPKPLSVSEVQHRLRPGEAVYQVAIAKNEIFGWSEVYAWIVTPEAMRGVILSIDEPALADAVDALRCGLDASSWNSRGADEEEKDERGLDRVRNQGERGRLGPERCRLLVGARPAGEALPFDLAQAHELYRTLFTPFVDLIRNKHLLVVQTGPLSTLPFHVLVTEPPAPGTGYADAAWLGLSQPITVLPSVPSLKALRGTPRQRTANPYMGFGNPLLAGRSGNDRRAWARQACTPQPSPSTRLPGPVIDRAAAAEGGTRPILRGLLQDFYRNGLGNVTMIRQQEPLPETADELCSVASALGAADSAVFLGARATETRLKALSAEGRLGASRVVHFATHGLVAAETEVLAHSRLEPALIMTPPDESNEVDDGLLTASEVAQLKLNADFVILSACNTAAGDGKAGGQALSGLARAFLYAGSQSLLVSHWYVNSDAAVDLVTEMFRELQANPALGRAEALRRAMAAQVSQGRFRAHPAYWAPFVIVGEGG